MNRLLASLGLVLMLTGCTGASTPSERPSRAAATVSSTSVPTPTPTPKPKPTSKPTPSPSLAPLPKGLVSYPVGSNDSPLPYLEYLPPGYDKGKPRPLLVFLHGVDEDANGSEASLRKILDTGIPQMIAEGTWPPERPFVVLMPQEPAAKSGACDFAPEIDRFLDFAVDRYEIDESRIHLTGISCGAIGVWDYVASANGGRVAAAVPIVGHPGYAMDRFGCGIASRTPLWVFQDGLDEIIPIDWVTGKIAELRACTAAPPKELKLTVYPDANHEGWTRTYDLSAGNDIYAWLLAHQRE